MSTPEEIVIVKNPINIPNQSNERVYNFQDFLQKYFKLKNNIAREFLAEIFGIFLLLVFGLSSVAQAVFFEKDSNGKQNGFLSINIAFGFGATIASIVVGKVSGCHINPAVSLAMLLTGRMSILRFFIYVIGQLIGAFLGAFLVFVVYLDAIYKYEPSLTLKTAGIFATYPNNPHLSVFGAFFDQFFATALLVIIVLAITDKKNNELPNGTAPIIVGLAITIIGTSFGYNCGYAINPARDFAPRLFTLIAGWGSSTFTAHNYFFWIPIVGPLVGSLAGTLVYSILISNNWP